MNEALNVGDTIVFDPPKVEGGPRFARRAREGEQPEGVVVSQVHDESTIEVVVGKCITDGTKVLDADGLRRIWELLAVVHHNAATYQGSAFARALVEIEEAVTQIRALLPDFEKV